MSRHNWFLNFSSSPEDYVIKSAYPDTALPKGNLAEYVLEKGRRFTNSIALVSTIPIDSLSAY